MPKGCYRRFVILLAVPPHSSRQLLCPSPHFVHFFLATLDSASLHPLHSSSIHFSQVQYTRCQFFCARRPPHLGYVHLASLRLIPSVHSPTAAKVHLHSSATYVPCGKDTPVASYGAGHRPGCPGLPVQPLCGGSPPASVHSSLILSGGRQTARDRSDNWFSFSEYFISTLTPLL